MFFRNLVLLSLVTFGSSLYAMSPKLALQKLVEGNRRFTDKPSECINRTEEARKSSKFSQQPFAVIVACADSRVAPEIVFDQGIGDLFVVRVAGNVIGSLDLESIIYAVKHLNSSCIVVMGHQNCGAVDAVIQDSTGDIPFIGQLIRPSVIKARSKRPKNLLKVATELNAISMVDFLMNIPEIQELKRQGKLESVAAYYSFSTGKVEFL